ncbi:hypothetical protein BIW11_07425, partial [Tropilaelaps mercedesae]
RSRIHTLPPLHLSGALFFICIFRRCSNSPNRKDSSTIETKELNVSDNIPSYSTMKIHLAKMGSVKTQAQFTRIICVLFHGISKDLK